MSQSRLRAKARSTLDREPGQSYPPLSWKKFGTKCSREQNMGSTSQMLSSLEDFVSIEAAPCPSGGKNGSLQHRIPEPDGLALPTLGLWSFTPSEAQGAHM